MKRVIPTAFRFIIPYSVPGLMIMILFFWTSCKHEDDGKSVDQELFNQAGQTIGYQWYRNGDSLLPRSTGSGHNEAFLRTRYNATATSVLDPDGKIKTDAVFPEGSMVVKELYATASAITRYAILYKNSSHAYADPKGWVWGYINADGTVAVSATEKGSACISCHSQSGNIDYMLMNKYFP